MSCYATFARLLKVVCLTFLDVVEIDLDVLVSVESVLFVDESYRVKHLVHRYSGLNTPIA